jgi:hypothetical protein
MVADSTAPEIQAAQLESDSNSKTNKQQIGPRRSGDAFKTPFRKSLNICAT